MRQLSDGRDAEVPAMDDSAMAELSRYPWPGNIRELRNVLERALVMFPQKTVTANQVRENLLRMKAPDQAEEMDALWAASEGLGGIDLAQDAGEFSRHYIQRTMPTGSAILTLLIWCCHLRDIEVVLIEAALEKSNGMVSQAAEALKLRRTTLIEKMKKLMIEKPAQVETSSDATK